MASNSAFGDPTPNVVKQLRIDYLLNGKPVQKTVAENELLQLAEEREEAAASFEVARTGDGELVLTPWQPGVYTARTAHGRTARIPVKEGARRLTLAAPWSLRFPAGWGAPSRVRLERLISWPEHPDLAARTNVHDLPAYAARPLLGALPEFLGRSAPKEFLTVARNSLSPALGGESPAFGGETP